MKTTLTCGECRDLLPAYVGRELNTRARRLVSAHLDHCPSCERRYLSQRSFARDFSADLPAFGRADEQNLSRVWIAVQQNMRSPRRSALRRYPLRAGAVILALLLIVSIPLSIGGDYWQQFSLPPTPPTPNTDLAETTVSTAEVVSVVAMATSAPKRNTTTMPTLPNQPNYAPTAVATDTP